MKSVGLCVLYSALFVFLAGCGKDNKSGTSANSWGYANPYTSGYGGIGAVNSPYSYGSVSLNQVMAENPCISGYGTFPGGQGPYQGQRITIQQPLTNFQTVIPANDIYVGVTSYGDVAALVGTAPGQPPMFVAYLCPRSFATSGQGQILGVKPGTYTNCQIKPIVAATVALPGGATADFRMLDYGSSARMPFTFCRQ